MRVRLVLIGFLGSTSMLLAADARRTTESPASDLPPIGAGRIGAAATSTPEIAGLLGVVGPKEIDCKGRAVRPNDALQALAEAAGDGATLCLHPGTYARQHVSPRRGQSFIGMKGAILDGQNVMRRAFDGTAPGVTIRNLTIRNYTAGNQDAPVFAAHGPGWRILDNEIDHNAGIGVSTGKDTIVSGNTIHHNAQAGYGTATPGAPRIENNEIAFNNYEDKFDPGFEAGGGKISLSNGAIVRHNWIHENHGPGIWTDIDNTNYTAEWNLVEDNCCGGIFHEISWTAIIQHNVVRNNSGPTCPGWLWCAGILIAASGGSEGRMIDVSYNTVVSNGTTKGNGIALIQQSRGSGKFGVHLVQNVFVHDNIIDVSNGGSSGAVQDNGDTAVFSIRNNRMDRNTYKIGMNTEPFAWANGTGGKMFIQGFGQEASGTFR